MDYAVIERLAVSVRGCFFAAAVACLAMGTVRPALAQSAPIRHVFVIVLENHSFINTFGDKTWGPYLARTLTRQGALLTNYYGIGHASLDNYIAMISGQPPNEDTQADCGTYTQFKMRQKGLDPYGQAIGRGCVYPASVKTLADQLEAKGFTWRAYLEDMGRDPSRENRTCAHPKIGVQDNTQQATIGDQYAAKHNPFVYFHSIIDDRARCDSHVVSLDKLPGDLGSSAPNFSFIVPNLCNDGHDIPCIDHRTGGLTTIDPFLARWVLQILGSRDFKRDGLLVITFDEAASQRGGEDSAACCGEEPMPGSTWQPGVNGPGGGRIGAVLLSPQIRPGTLSAVPYNHYSLLRSIEDLFGLAHLAMANGTSLTSFGKDVFGRVATRPLRNRPSCGGSLSPAPAGCSN
jgi:phosphatidylinositol-3-phosphatase